MYWFFLLHILRSFGPLFVLLASVFVSIALLLWNFLIYISETFFSSLIFSFILHTEPVPDATSMYSHFLQLLICLFILIFQVTLYFLFFAVLSGLVIVYNNRCCRMYQVFYICFISSVFLQ